MLIAATALFSLQNLLSAHSALLPLSGTFCLGVAATLFRAPLRPFGLRESESLMNFAGSGALHCHCAADHGQETRPDRRQVCRSCGCEVAAVDPLMLEKPLSADEIRRMTRSLRQAAIRASNLQLPPSVSSISQLNTYLASDVLKQIRLADPAHSPMERALEQPTIH